MEKPNIVLITTDTQRCDTLRCMGNPHAVSPHIDRLAQEGVLFTQAHTASPVCSPARCSLLTGVHTPIHGCIENGIRRREDLIVFPDLLKEHGYTNIMVGKTHFGPVPASFDVQHIVAEKNADVDDCYARFIRRHGYPRVTSHPNPVPEHLFMDAFLADTTIAEIERAASMGKGSFFAYCSMVSPHGPFDPPGEWAHLYDGRPLPEINYMTGELAAHPAHLKRLLGLNGKESRKRAAGEFRSPEDPAFRQKADELRRLYYGLAAYCDAQVGKIIDFLDRAGLRRNTLVIFSSDHGQQFFDHGFNDKHNFYDASWRIPLILSMPGTLAENETRDFAVWTDLTATILGAAGISSSAVQGFDLFTPLANGEPSPRRCAVGTLYKSAALATKYWKLEYYFEEGEGRLFNRLDDPAEQNDLYRSEAHEDVRNAMLHALLTWRADLTDIGALHRSTGGGGPVARRIAPYTLSMRGTDAERRLNERAERIDLLYGPGGPRTIR
jgi:arylsulfatase A-like enzyme